MSEKREPSTLGLTAILSISFVMMAFMATMPAMAALGVQYGEQYGSLLSLLSNGYIITVVPITLVSGWLTNSGRMKYKTATLWGSLLMLVGGMVTIFYHPGFWFLFFAKLVFGVGLGFLTPLYNALILNLYEGSKQARYLGWTTLLMDLGGILIQVLAGVLVDTFGAGADGNGWFMHYWAYAFAIIPLILSFFIPEPERDQTSAMKSVSDAPKIREKMGAMAIIAGILLLIVNLLNFPTMMYMANLFIARGIGGDTAATAAGTTLSCFAVAGAFSGALYGTLFKAFKRFTPAMAFVFMAIGAIFIYFAGSMGVAVCGTIFLGFGFSMIIPACMSLIGMHTPMSRMTLATSIAMALMNLGGLIATPYLAVLGGIFGSGMEFLNAIFIIEAVGYGICAIILMIWNPYPKAAPAAPTSE